jgi:hypothetical protein
LSRADKTLAKITYEITLDDTNENIVQLKVLTLCAMKNGGMKVDRKVAFSTAQHIAFTATYTFSQQNAVDGFSVPAPAAKLLK